MTMIEPVIAASAKAAQVHQEMDNAYRQLADTLRERPDDDEALRAGDALADALGRRYERLCDEICRTETRTLEGVLAKLQCATQCIRDILPEGTDPEQACDIELRFVVALERDVRRLVARYAAQQGQPSSEGHPPEIEKLAQALGAGRRATLSKGLVALRDLRSIVGRWHQVGVKYFTRRRRPPPPLPFFFAHL
jgi:hypothetical protein